MPGVKGVGLTLKQLKEMQDGNELDLDMQQLTAVPVMLLQQLKHKPTILNLSLNLLQTIGEDFTSLTFIVKLDLSQNQLTSLPDGFGKLKSLQHLDLYKNNLTTLPSSMSQMKSLRWLDVKDNPLDDNIAKVAGQCLDAKQCQTAATKVVQFLAAKQSEDERRRQKGLQTERERLAEENAAEELERKKQRDSKKLEKDKRRKEKAAINHQQQVNTNLKKKINANNANGKASSNDKRRPTKVARTGWLSCIGYLVYSLIWWLVMAAIGVVLGSAFVLFANCNAEKPFIPHSATLCKQIYSWAREGDKRPSMLSIGSAMFGVKQLCDKGIENTQQLAKNWQLDVAFHKTQMVLEDSWQVARKKSAPYLEKISPYTEWLWKETKCFATCAFNSTVEWTRVAFQYTLYAIQHSIELAKDFIQNYPIYWEKVKFYWQNMK